MSSPDLPTPWLRAVIAAAVGLAGSACAQRTIDDDGFDELGNDTETTEYGTTEYGTTDVGETGSVPPEPQPYECMEDVITIEWVVGPDGRCEPCDDACRTTAYELASGSSICEDTCACDVYLICESTVPNEDGACLHGFGVDTWCGEGRPLLVDDEVRVAPERPRSDWLCEAPRLAVPASLRERVHAGWLARAAMEHASVAAFARFCVQLIGLGAPAELVEAAQISGLDEARHARLCYAVAAGIGGRELGPDRLDLGGLDLELDPSVVARESILEGCIGETVAAAKMRYLAAQVHDPDVRELLREIAEDEARHAALAWKVLCWMLERFDIEDEVRRTFEAALAEAARRPAPGHDELVAHGVLDGATSDWITAAVLRDVIAPAAAGLLERRSPSRPERSSVTC